MQKLTDMLRKYMRDILGSEMLRSGDQLRALRILATAPL